MSAWTTKAPIQQRLQVEHEPDATDAMRDEAETTASLRDIISRDEVPRVDDEGATKASVPVAQSSTQPTIDFILTKRKFIRSSLARAFILFDASIERKANSECVILHLIRQGSVIGPSEDLQIMPV